MRTREATDASGNTYPSIFRSTVVDTTAPTITCVPDKTVECTAAWTFDAPTFSDTCGLATNAIVSTVTNTAGHCGNTFDATRTWEATDACGNKARCSQKVTVVDTTAPSITCVADKTVECTAAWTFDAPSFSDTCGLVTNAIVSTVTNSVGHCGNTFDATRTWEATDACGNKARCSQKVTIVDTTAPIMSCAADKTVQCGADWKFDEPAAIDTCSSVT